MTDRVLIVGSGSAATRHARDVRALLPDARIVLWSQSRAGKLDPVSFGVDSVVASQEEATGEEPQVTIVANDATHHAVAAAGMAEAGSHLLVEKPIATTLEDADRVIRAAEANKVVLMVAYGLRFHPALVHLRRIVSEGALGEVLGAHAEVGQRLSDWRPGRDPLTTASASRSRGGGVILELSHEIDYVCSILGRAAAVTATAANKGSPSLEVEDVADLMLEHERGITSTIHLNMVQAAPTRTCRVVGAEATATCDLLGGTVYVTETGGTKVAFEDGAAAGSFQVRMLRHFLSCAEAGKAPEPSGDDAREALRVALAAKESASGRKRVVL